MQDSTYEEQKENPSTYHKASNFQDDSVFAIDLAHQNAGAILSSIPKTWFSKPKGASLPAKFKQTNWIGISVAKLLGKPIHSLPFPSNQSRIICPCTPFPKGAIAVGYDDLQQTIDVKYMLNAKGHTTSPYRPLMQRVESSGWPANLRPEEINRHIQTFNISGLHCYHTLKGSYKGTAHSWSPITTSTNYKISPFPTENLPSTGAG
jgi:hypothetical protein